MATSTAKKAAEAPASYKGFVAGIFSGIAKLTGRSRPRARGGPNPAGESRARS